MSEARQPDCPSDPRNIAPSIRSSCHSDNLCPGHPESQHKSSWKDLIYSTSSLVGLVSSKRKLQWPPFSSAMLKFRWADLAWPICIYPFGSGGNRVITLPPNLPDELSFWIAVRMKSFAVGFSLVVNLYLLKNQRISNRVCILSPHIC